MFTGYNTYLNHRNQRRRLFIKFSVGSTIFSTSGRSMGRPMLIVQVTNDGAPAQVSHYYFLAVNSDKRYRPGGEFETKVLQRGESQSLHGTPEKLAEPLKKDGFENWVSVVAVVVDNTGVAFKSDPLEVNVNAILQQRDEDARKLMEAAKSIQLPPVEPFTFPDLSRLPRPKI